MSVIYQPKGPAREYANLAVRGPYDGCPHGCVYCYRKALAQRLAGKVGWDDANPRPRPGFLQDLAAEADKLAQGPRKDCPLFFSFNTDPLQPLELEHRLTAQAAGLLVDRGLRMAICTKGGMEAALPVLECLAGDPRGAARHWFGVTLTGVGHSWEPGAAFTAERAQILLKAQALGLRTWISFEPVLIPEATLSMLRAAIGHRIDHVALGRWNHDSRANQIDWPNFRRQAQDLLEHNGYRGRSTNLPEPGHGEWTYYLKSSLDLKEAA